MCSFTRTGHSCYVEIARLAETTSADVILHRRYIKELNTKNPIFRPVPFLVEFDVVLAAFGVVLVAPHTGWCVIVAYESRARRRRRHHNHNDVRLATDILYIYRA